MKSRPHDTVNPHMWIPNLDEEPFTETPVSEVCRLCGIVRNRSHDNNPDPPEVALPCPESWPPSLPEFAEAETGERLLACRACRAVNTFDMWHFSGKFCPECGSNSGSVKA